MSAPCPSCAQPVAANSAFCANCGARVSAVAAAEIGPSQDQKNLAMLLWIGTIFFGFIPGLIVYLIKSDPNTDAYVRNQAKEALNWSITAIFGYLIGFVLTFVLIGVLVLVAVGLLNLVFSIMGAVASSNGRAFRTPMTIRLLK